MNINIYYRLLLWMGLCSVLAFCRITMADEQDDNWSKAMTNTINKTKRLEPSSFVSESIPDNVINELKKHGCKIPQAAHIPEPHNLISGEFAKKGQKDWAALCSRNLHSSILLIWGGTSTCPSEIASIPDKESIRFPYVNETGTSIDPEEGENHKLQGYLRRITKVPDELLTRPIGNGSPVDDDTNRKMIDHEAIEDGMTIDANYTHEFYYCMLGEWRKWGDRNSD